MSGQIAVDLSSAVPPYEQIRAQVRGLVAAGVLNAGDRLPTVRDLAADLGVAVGTVQRAYRELESAGVVVSRRRTGTVVASGAGASASDQAFRARAQSFVREARSAGMSDADILTLIRGALSSTRPLNSWPGHAP